jgi:dihydroxyacid dehydratase/phosphogluconate dehydratase
MVRISDARMSGTAFGTIVLHITPESAAGGPLALVQTGDRIRLDVPKRSIELLVDDAELQRRAALFVAPPRMKARTRLFVAVPAARHAGRRRLRLRLPQGESIVNELRQARAPSSVIVRRQFA